MNKKQYLSSLQENIDQFTAAANLGLAPAVSGCPGWNVGRLVAHMGEVFDFWSTVVERRAPDENAINQIQKDRKTEIDRLESPDFHNSPAVIEYFQSRAEAIVRALSDADPAQTHWTWWPGNQTTGFVQRRMCHEIIIHRWDAQSAHDVATPVTPPEIAADGIDEELNNQLTGWGGEEKVFPDASFHIHCTDTQGEWMVIAKPTSVELRREHGKADIAVSGEASSLLLWLWGRLPVDSLTIHGDARMAPVLRGMLDQE